MDHRNIRRSFLLSKALKKYNKHNKLALQRAHINYLYCILMLGGKDQYVSISKVQVTLRFVKLAAQYWNVNNNLSFLYDRGYLIKHETLLLFRLSIEGINVLNGLETCLRKERWNR